ncbi:uncharacterized protein LAESUDRAFT_717328 [Laetiporus sulphureus 93-53]|uniref:Uncharacterized protein n=1 Tax=Laetiporus sulphureus 93-53 TaxID=1314785 RepID=A0A165BW42_9APHY|nr:uncharacterized protein LAESUDRAFT_717328 [Laetiporus sulphureus 93-53]KZT01758.1 hypothetical protein LAESUDRAFT_717328 [Laetiporus sulphureus 93-53]
MYLRQCLVDERYYQARAGGKTRSQIGCRIKATAGRLVLYLVLRLKVAHSIRLLSVHQLDHHPCNHTNFEPESYRSCVSWMQGELASDSSPSGTGDLVSLSQESLPCFDMDSPTDAFNDQLVRLGTNCPPRQAVPLHAHNTCYVLVGFHSPSANQLAPPPTFEDRRPVDGCPWPLDWARDAEHFDEVRPWRAYIPIALDHAHPDHWLFGLAAHSDDIEEVALPEGEASRWVISSSAKEIARETLISTLDLSLLLSTRADYPLGLKHPHPSMLCLSALYEHHHSQDTARAVLWKFRRVLLDFIGFASYLLHQHDHVRRPLPWTAAAQTLVCQTILERPKRGVTVYPLYFHSRHAPLWIDWHRHNVPIALLWAHEYSLIPMFDILNPENPRQLFKFDPTTFYPSRIHVLAEHHGCQSGNEVPRAEDWGRLEHCYDFEDYSSWIKQVNLRVYFRDRPRISGGSSTPSISWDGILGLPVFFGNIRPLIDYKKRTSSDAATVRLVSPSRPSELPGDEPPESTNSSINEPTSDAPMFPQSLFPRRVRSLVGRIRTPMVSIVKLIQGASIRAKNDGNGSGSIALGTHARENRSRLRVAPHFLLSCLHALCRTKSPSSLQASSPNMAGNLISSSPLPLSHTNNTSPAASNDDIDLPLPMMPNNIAVASATEPVAVAHEALILRRLPDSEPCLPDYMADSLSTSSNNIPSPSNTTAATEIPATFASVTAALSPDIDIRSLRQVCSAVEPVVSKLLGFLCNLHPPDYYPPAMDLPSNGLHLVVDSGYASASRISLPARSELRVALFLLVHPDVKGPDILRFCLSHGLAFKWFFREAYGIQRALAFSTARPLRGGQPPIWARIEREILPDLPISDDRRSALFAYRHSIAVLLGRSHVQRLLSYGGLTWRLVLHFAGPEVLEHVGEGPSATWMYYRRQGSPPTGNGYVLENFSDPADDEELALLIGAFTSGASYWPPISVFMDSFHWTGEWTAENVDWFERRWAAIENLTSGPISIRQWRRNFARASSPLHNSNMDNLRSDSAARSFLRSCRGTSVAICVVIVPSFMIWDDVSPVKQTESQEVNPCTDGDALMACISAQRVKYWCWVTCRRTSTIPSRGKSFQNHREGISGMIWDGKADQADVTLWLPERRL